MGPTMFLWMRFTATIWPGRSFKSSISKAITEQFTYDPAAICAFLFLMTLFEGKSTEDAKQEVFIFFFKIDNGKVVIPIENNKISGQRQIFRYIQSGCRLLANSTDY